jgi:hypothetical protein
VWDDRKNSVAIGVAINANSMIRAITLPMAVRIITGNTPRS